METALRTDVGLSDEGQTVSLNLFLQGGLNDFVSRLTFQVRLTEGEDGLWYADCADLDGCHTFGETKEQALENIHEVIGDRILANVDDE